MGKNYINLYCGHVEAPFFGNLGYLDMMYLSLFVTLILDYDCYHYYSTVI